MANEFIIKHGFLSKGNSQVTGSLGITGSVDIEISSGSAFIINESDSPGSFFNRLDFHFDNKNPVLEIAARQAQSTFILSQDSNAIQTSFTNQGLIVYKVQAGTNYGIQLGPEFKPNTTNQQDLGNFNRRWKNLYLYASNKISWGTVNNTDLVSLRNINTTNTLQVSGSSDVILDVKGVVSASKFTANSGSSAALPGYSFHHASGTGLYSQAAGYLQLQVNGGGSPEFELTTGQATFRVPIQLTNNELINPSRIRGLGSITGSSSGNNLGVSASLDLDGDLSIAGDGVISGSLLISSSNVGGVSTASMTLQGSGSTIFDIQGSQGQLFSVTDDLIHDVFNVSDISGDTLLKVSGSGLVEIPVGPISSSGLLFISASENAGQSTYKTLVQDPATGRIYHTGSYGTGGGGGGEWKDLGTTITSSKDVQITGSLIASGSVVNFASASSVILPAETVPLINPKVEYLTISEITSSGTTVPLPNSLTFVSSSAFEYLEIFINGLRLRYDIDFAPMSTSTVKYLTTIPSGSEVTYKSLKR